jgi:hypothetical protein
VRHGPFGVAIAGAALAAILIAPVAPSVTAAGPSCEFTGVDRIVAVGDVHGAYDRMVGILQTAGLIDARLRWTGGKTHLVQLGDVVDRGPDSRKALDLLRKLEEDASRAGGAVHLLLGNHEAMRMLGDMRYVVDGEYKAFASNQSEDIKRSVAENIPKERRDQFLKETPLGEVEMMVAFGRQGPYGQWLRTLPVVIKINGILFLHGGISPATADMSCETLNTSAQRELTEDLEKTRADSLHSLVGGEDGPLWYRGLAEEPDTFAPTVEDILARQDARAIVIGHTITPDLRIRPRFNGRVFQIDTGMQPLYVARGRASALDIQNGVFTAIYADRRDVLPTPADVPRRSQPQVPQ